MALRHSRLDFNRGPIQGGEAENWTLGLSWYLNSNVRLMLNYVTSAIDHRLYSGRVSSLQGRLQFDF
ncbi:MAG: Phosphate-selective porin O and P [Candidatus Hydrogenedentes bacterium ADurb.Bin101]|nr:MAG: Phosphate-selective porin O and P [Candidatus Hydrogenedentes bacterium ADurb.Bin101]HOC67737.1 porin [Candidatus Hydrogenedentota bacterium]